MLKFRQIATMLVIMLMTAVSASAQKNIEAALAALTKKYPDARITYSEFRTPKTHKLERVTQVISMSDQDEYNKLLRALEADAAESVRFTKVTGVVTVKFEDDGKVSTYSLLKSATGSIAGQTSNKKPGDWMLSITIRNEDD
ncbi:MAG: hypothetical protein K2O27_04120 [Candidatus Amulumruptor sp.]|nr:hypothetical protein [Candidatus Amulumruptor sp.]